VLAWRLDVSVVGYEVLLIMTAVCRPTCSQVVMMAGERSAVVSVWSSCHMAVAAESSLINTWCCLGRSKPDSDLAGGLRTFRTTMIYHVYSWDFSMSA